MPGPAAIAPDAPVLLFPGQGLHYIGMGKTLAEEFPVAREVFEQVDDTLGFALTKIAWEGPEDALTRTRNAQPAILAHSLAAYRVMRERLDIVPGAVAGHSLGEWSALVAAEVLDLSDAIRLVHLRGRFMEEALPVGVGGMLAIFGLDCDRVETICHEAAGGSVLSIATHNGPGHFVVAGHRDALPRAAERALAHGAISAQEIQVSTPFHCALMSPAADALANELTSVTFRTPVYPVRSTIIDAWVSADHPASWPELLATQVTAPVLWRQAIEAIATAGATHGFAVGPGKSLIGMVKRIARRLPVRVIAEASDLAP